MRPYKLAELGDCSTHFTAADVPTRENTRRAPWVCDRRARTSSKDRRRSQSPLRPRSAPALHRKKLSFPGRRRRQRQRRRQARREARAWRIELADAPSLHGSTSRRDYAAHVRGYVEDRLHLGLYSGLRYVEDRLHLGLCSGLRYVDDRLHLGLCSGLRPITKFSSGGAPAQSSGAVGLVSGGGRRGQLGPAGHKPTAHAPRSRRRLFEVICDSRLGSADFGGADLGTGVRHQDEALLTISLHVAEHRRTSI